MAYNVPSYDTGNLSFGPGVVYIGATGTTPTTDVGAVDVGMALAHAVELLDVQQGNPRELIESFRTVETVTFTFTGLEWKVANLDKFLGGGEVSGDTFKYGGSLRSTHLSLKLVHQMPPASGHTVGSTVIIDVWDSRSAGDLTMTFGMDLHNFPVSVAALNKTTDWGGVTLSAGQQYYKLQIQEAP